MNIASTRFWSLALACGILVAVAACGSSARTVLNDQPQAQLPSHAAAWAALAQNPGTPGRDYDPRRILVSYSTGASLPSGWPQPVPGAASAASQPNAVLLRDPGYEVLTDALAQRYGLSIRQQVYMGSLHYASFELPAGADGSKLLARLRREAATMLDAAVFSPLKHASYAPNDPAFFDPGGDMWSHYRVNCDDAWELTTGSPAVIVAVCDTGVNIHEDLGQQVIDPSITYPSAFCDVANNDKIPEDTDGHGTFIAGIVAATGNNSTAGAGVAFNCLVLPIKIANSGDTLVDDLVAGALLADQLGAQVINYSWGGPDLVPIEQNMVNTVTANGRLFVCAAGNDGVATDEYPSAFSNALSVGATNSFDARASFSNWGPSVDIAAPGEGLLGCAHDDFFGYYYIDGTSFAAPMVAAAGALIWSLDSSLSLNEVRGALVNNGPLQAGFTNQIHRLDVRAAIDAVYQPAQPSIGSISPASGATLGAVTGSSSVQASVNGAQNVTRVDYVLDRQPLGSPGPEDLIGSSTTGPSFSYTFDLSGLSNGACRLVATYYGVANQSGISETAPVWIFNQRGDMNADGVVDSADLAALQLIMGSVQSDQSYLRYADSDLDGAISEADAAAIGYFYGTGSIIPSISGVTPESGYSGQAQSFSAALAGSGQLRYQWVFGGGATPNTSAQPAPTVTLKSTGKYNARLTVSNDFGSDTYEFTLDVSPAPIAPVVTLVSPTNGASTGSLSLGATVSGTSPFSYFWDFGGGALPNQTNVDSPVVTLGAPGNYAAYVTVSNAAGSDQYDFVLQVDAAPVAPVIESVQPNSGTTETQLLIGASVTGTQPLSYSWNFGGGGSPNTSSETTPSITLGAPGNYQGQLSVSNSIGTDVFNFVLDVQADAGPTAVLDATPLKGVVPLEVQFDASGSFSPGESIDLYQWSWTGDPSWDEQGSSPLSSHNFNTVGLHPVLLRVTDSAAKTDDILININVTATLEYDDWNGIELGPFYGHEAGGVDITEVDGKPAVIWSSSVPSSVNTQILVSRATVAAPDDAGQWQFEQVFSGTAYQQNSICALNSYAAFAFTYGAGIMYGSYASGSLQTHTVVNNTAQYDVTDPGLCVVGTKPSLFYIHSDPPDDAEWAEYAGSTVSNPQSQADWTFSIPQGLPEFGHQQGPFSTAAIGGKPYFCRSRTAPSTVQLVYGLSANPTANDWNVYGLGGLATSSPVSKLYSINSLPEVLYEYRDPIDDLEIRFSSSSVQQPDSDDDWSHHVIPAGVNQGIESAGNVNGKPVFMVRELGKPFAYLAKTALPASASDWLKVTLPDPLEPYALLDHGNDIAFLGIDRKGTQDLYDDVLVYYYPVG